VKMFNKIFVLGAILLFVLGQFLIMQRLHQMEGESTAMANNKIMGSNDKQHTEYGYGGYQDLLPHLQNCDKPQSRLSLQQLAKIYKPTKFTYSHSNYDRIYPFYLERYRYKKFRMLEIGLDTGNGSLLWQEYFPCGELYGLEYRSSSTNTEGASKIKAIQGDQGDREFLEGEFLDRTNGGNFDVIIDDGGHHYEQQTISYEVLFDKALQPGGLYLLEDIETSYWKKGTTLYGSPVTRGGQSEPETVINKFKLLVDVVNKKFYDNTYTVFGQVDHWIATIGFMSNMIILTKKDKSHCFAEKYYIWKNRLADDCPAQTQSFKDSTSPVKKYCQTFVENIFEKILPE